MFEIQFSKKALRDLRALPRPILKRIVEKINLLKENPFKQNIKKLAGQPYFRMRIGDYRVIFAIFKKEFLILVIKIAHRKNIYK
ncbi:MAG: type II toxin-antitoxin system RelE family toxin [Promethearchaeota archaeon]